MLFAQLKSCVAHRNAWEVAGVLHRDISVNNIMILESMEPDGMIGRLAVLCDFDLCTYREHMGVEQRAGGFAVRCISTFLFLFARADDNYRAPGPSDRRYLNTSL